ncbi:toll/interleukin-1 receptor domain-containing protein [Saccharothrix sp. Mg75]|uniref:toll/interleukin-1 receptor domain-containing protein n=1 Tax=Saccharothrix sp. Mg75 TaxID=3445357 RepID=UPI003EE8C2BC
MNFISQFCEIVDNPHETSRTLCTSTGLDRCRSSHHRSDVQRLGVSAVDGLTESYHAARHPPASTREEVFRVRAGVVPAPLPGPQPEEWITSRTYSALTCINDVMSGTACPRTDINTTIARRRRTGSFAVRPIRASFRPSSIDNGRTNTSRRRPTTTSRSTGENQPGPSDLRSTLLAMPSDEAKHVFVSYVREDAEKVDQLCEALDAANIPYWRDKTALAPGDQWKQKVRDAIRSGSLVFLACFSEQTKAKPRSYMNEELTLAAEEFRQYPPEATWLIPVRFDDVEVPAWDLGAGRTLSDLNYADLFGSRYVPNLVSLTNTVSKVIGTTSPDPATVRASVEEADDADRLTKLRQLTKDMILDPAKRIELNDLITDEAQRISTAMRDGERFPTDRLGGTNDEHVMRCAEVTADYWKLAEPFCASLQIAARWGEGQVLAPWASALRTIASEATKSVGGNVALLHLRHVPAFTATFTAALAAVGDGQWNNLKTLLLDITLPSEHGGGRDPLMQVEHVWTVFDEWQDLLPNVVARAAQTGKEPRAVYKMFASNQATRLLTPVADWLYAILRPHFKDQYTDDVAYDEAFDRTEVLLGLLSQDIWNAWIGTDPERAWSKRSYWFGRSTWRARYGGGALADVTTEIETQGTSWAPLAAGLFGGRLERATTAAKDYAEGFNKMARPR